MCQAMERNPEIKEAVIRIDKEGNWFYNGLPIINKKIYLFFNKHLETGTDGNYIIRVGDETCRLEVEDTPYVVNGLSLVKSEEDGRSCFKIRLNDETEENLDLNSLYINPNNIPYCKVKSGKFPARFLRAAYYQLAQYIENDRDEFYLSLNGEKIPVRFSGCL